MIFVIFMCMNDVLIVLIDIDIIPNYNYYILLHFRGACIHLYLMCLLFADVMRCLYSAMMLLCENTG